MTEQDIQKLMKAVLYVVENLESIGYDASPTFCYDMASTLREAMDNAGMTLNTGEENGK